MNTPQSYRIAVFSGDGIGPEVMAPTLALLERACEKAAAPKLIFEDLPGGAGAYQENGIALPDTSVEAARAADAILLSAMGDPSVRYPDGTEITPQIELRMILGLYAGVRPVRTFPGMPVPLRDPRAQSLDLVLIRESTEGLFSPDAPGSVSADEARETMLITRTVTEKLADFGFRLAKSRAERRRGSMSAARVTCIDKANVFPAFAFMRTVFDERASLHSDINSDHMYVDAAAMNLVKRPWDFDVAVTENMFGDILSDLCAALMGGLGFAPSADIGDRHAVFQPCHGTAPDIVGKGLANPTAMILSVVMMLEWLSEQKNCTHTAKAAALLQSAVEAAFADGNLVPTEAGGEHGTQAVVDAVSKELG